MMDPMYGRMDLGFLPVERVFSPALVVMAAVRQDKRVGHTRLASERTLGQDNSLISVRLPDDLHTELKEGCVMADISARTTSFIMRWKDVLAA